MSATQGELTVWHRYDTAAAFTSANPVLGVKEWGIETDTGLFKIGDGTTAWTSLGYIGSGSATSVNAAIATTAATNSSPYGYAQTQADNIRILINQLRAIMVARGLAV
jgi:hypothetical protein